MMPLYDMIPPVSLGVSRANLLDRFLSDAALELLPVVENDRPVGMITRGQFASALLQEGTLGGSIQGLMLQNPVIVSIEDGPDRICDQLQAAVPGAPGCIMVKPNGTYLGIVSLAALLMALRHDHRQSGAAQDPVKGAMSSGPSSSARDRELFISAVARQIDGPLEGIISLSERLSRQPLTNDGRTQVNTIVETGRSVLQLVRDAAELGRIDAGDIVVTPESLVLSDLMADMEDAWRIRAETAGLTLMMSYEGPQTLAVSVDAGLVRRLFNTLVERALAATPRGIVEASLKARIEPAGVHLEGRIRDGGPSLPPHRMARIFEPMSDRAGGSFVESVGLALCNRIIVVMKGTIRAESNVGAGSSIAFDLLAPQLAYSPEGSALQGAEFADGQISAHVLVVDDNGTNRMVAEALCEMFGCTSEAVEDGVEAVEYAATGRFDVALMDIKMPRMDGVAATLAIRALPSAARDLPIIALTANADPEDVRRYISIGMCDVVDKPIKSDRLRGAIKAALASVVRTGSTDSSAVA